MTQHGLILTEKDKELLAKELSVTKLGLIYIYRTKFGDLKNRQVVSLKKYVTKRKRKEEGRDEGDGKQEEIYQEDRAATCEQGVRGLDALLVGAGNWWLQACVCDSKIHQRTFFNI